MCNDRTTLQLRADIISMHIHSAAVATAAMLHFLVNVIANLFHILK